MKNILLLFLMTVGLVWCGTAMAQDDDDVLLEYNGCILKKDGTLIVTSSCDQYNKGFNYRPEIKRVVFEDDVYAVKVLEKSSGRHFESITFGKVSGAGWGLLGDYLLAVDTVYVPWENTSYADYVDSCFFKRTLIGTEGAVRQMPLLIVPKGCVEAYKASDWSRTFAYIGDEKGDHEWPIYMRDWSLEDGKLIIKKGFQWSGEHEFWYGQPIREVEIEEGVTEIVDYAFKDLGKNGGECDNVEVNLPKGLKRIGNGAFDGSCISSIKFKEGLEIIGANAFSFCEALCSIEFKSVKEIGASAFSWCENLSGKLVLPANLETIGPYAFDHCVSLQHVVLPASTKSVEFSAFGWISCEPGSDYGQFPHVRDFRVDCYALDPPAEDMSLLYCNAELHVPAESAVKYLDSWGKIKDEGGCYAIYSLDPDEENPYTALEDVKGGKLEVSVVGGVVSVEGVDEFDVYDISGRKMPAGRPLPAGVYVVSSSKGSERVVVK